MSHTPGPWHFDHDWRRLPTVYGDRGRTIVTIVEKDRVVDGWSVPLEQREANAKLITAAPDLLAALIGLLPEGWGDGVMDHMPGVKAAREAIVAAGGTPRGDS